MQRKSLLIFFLGQLAVIASFVVGLTKLTDDIWALNVASYILPIFVLIYAFKFNIIQASDIGLTWKINGYVTSQKKIILIGFFVFSGIMIYMFVGFLTRMVFPENLFEFGVDSEFTSEQLWIRFLLAIVYSAWAGVIEESYYRGILKRYLKSSHGQEDILYYRVYFFRLFTLEMVSIV